MNTLDYTADPYQSKAVDQLSNTLELMSCGILDFTLLNSPVGEETSPDLRLNFMEITHSLEQARGLLRGVQDGKALLHVKQSIAQSIEEIAVQTNLLALNVAFHATFTSRIQPEYMLAAAQANALAGRACATMCETLRFTSTL